MSNSFPNAVEISLVVSAGQWAAWAAGAALALLAVSVIEPAWRVPAALLWAALAAGSATRLLRLRRWRRAVWQPSGAFRLESDDAARVVQLGRHSYRSRYLIVLHMTDGAQNWYFALFRGEQPDAFRRCAARLRLAERLLTIR